MEKFNFSTDLSLEDERGIESKLEIWDKEARELLPMLSTDLHVVFDNGYLIHETGAGGFAHSRDSIALAFDPSYPDKEVQMENLKGSYFHEAYHTVQGFVGDDDRKISAIHNAIYEGAATVFERERAGSSPPWADYSVFEDPLKVVSEVAELPMDYDWEQWKFYHPEKNERWILYRLGVYIVERALALSPELKIEDLAQREPADILEISGVI